MKILVVAAGKNTRFKKDKALAKINGIENIVNTFNKIGVLGHKFYIATRKKRIPKYKKILPQATYIPIKKSEGCGQGTRDALKKIKGNPTILITWGDMYFKNTHFMKHFSSQYKPNKFNIFVEYEKHPYTSYIVDNQKNPMHVFYGRINNFTPRTGYGDRGVFITKRKKALKYLKKLKKKSGEYRLLDIVEDMYLNKDPANLIITENSGIKTYNTQKELEKIINEEKKESENNQVLPK